MGTTKRMDQILYLLKAYLRTRSFKATKRSTGASRNTVRRYIRMVTDSGLSVQEVLDLPEDQQRQLFYPGTPAAVFDARADFELHFEQWVKEKSKVGVTKQFLWEKYRQRVPNGYGYSRWCEVWNELKGLRNLAMVLEHIAGETLQFDYTGATIPWVDVDTGEVHQAQVLLAVFPYSHYTFAIALPSQRTVDFAYGISKALSFFGGAPKAIVSDNLKAYVIEPDRYEPTFNQVIEQLSYHYELDLSATRVRKPKDKAAVEGGVKTIYTRLFVPLHDRQFTSISQINEAFTDLLKAHNDMPFQKREGSRTSVFLELEKPALRPLPSTPFLPKTKVRAKVSMSYHVYLTERKCYYSVPFQCVGKMAEVIYNQETVEIFVGGKRVALHECHYPQDKLLYTTNLDHMPRNHREYQLSRGFDGAYFLRKAAAIGPASKWAMGQTLASRYHESQTYASCQGVLRLAERYGRERLEAAASYLQPYGKAGYRRLANVLKDKLDLVEKAPDLFTSIDHGNIRGPSAYQ